MFPCTTQNNQAAVFSHQFLSPEIWNKMVIFYFGNERDDHLCYKYLIAKFQ